MDLPEIRNRIDLGTLIQGAILMLTVVGAVLGTYFAVESQVYSNNQNIALLQQQQIQTIKWMQQIQEEQKNLADRTTTSLLKITDQLTDLRILLATIRDGSHDTHK